jgi:hypothetical protein
MKTKILLVSLCIMWQGLKLELLSQTTVTATAAQPAVLMAYAGSDATLNKGQTYILGSSKVATGGAGSYSYTWSPASGLNSQAVANPSLTASTTATYALTVTDAFGCTTTDDVKITVGQPSVISNIDQDNITVSPNPTTDNIIVGLPVSATPYLLTFFTYDGKPLWNRQIDVQGAYTKQEISLHNNEPGFYILIIRSGDNTWTRKIVKQ